MSYEGVIAVARFVIDCVVRMTIVCLDDIVTRTALYEARTDESIIARFAVKSAARLDIIITVASVHL